jgi:hypothetical protein
VALQDVLNLLSVSSCVSNLKRPSIFTIKNMKKSSVSVVCFTFPNEVGNGGLGFEFRNVVTSL